jgi:serine protease inhibitor
LGLVAPLFLGAQQTEEINPPSPSILPTEKQFFQVVVDGNNRFAFELYGKIKNRSGNFCFSPYSIVSGLAMAALGAKGDTAFQFQHAFHYSLSLLPLIADQNQLFQSSPSTAKNISQLWLANALWLQKDLKLLPSFKLEMQRNFRDNLQFLDFANELSKSIQTINQWVSQKTNGKINHLVTGQDVTTKTRFLLTMAISMRGQWEHQFELSQTKRLPFRLSSERTLLSDMMHTTSTYLLAKNDKWDLLVLPYVKGNQEIELAMALLLPKEVGGIEELEKNFTLPNWKQWLSQLQMETVSLTLPRFRIEDRFDLQTILKALGFTHIFTSEADFTGITEVKDLFMDKAIHKSLVRIDEKGTEITGVTKKDGVQTTVEHANPYEFVVDRPFLFVIWDRKTDSILFMGRVLLP